MYAIIESGNHQFKVQAESVIEVDRLDQEEGSVFETDRVLLVADDKKDTSVGTPYVSGAKVKGTVLDHYRGRKIIVFKFKRRKNYRRKQGHRQEMTRVRIDAIETA